MFPSLRFLFRGFRIAFRAPEVRALVTLVAALILVAAVFYRLVEG